MALYARGLRAGANGYPPARLPLGGVEHQMDFAVLDGVNDVGASFRHLLIRTVSILAG